MQKKKFQAFYQKTCSLKVNAILTLKQACWNQACMRTKKYTSKIKHCFFLSILGNICKQKTHKICFKQIMNYIKSPKKNHKIVLKNKINPCKTCEYL